MARTFTLEVVTPERVLFSSDQVVSVTAPGWEGSFGVMALHAPMVVALRTGVITVKLADGEEVHIATTGGFFEVADNRAVILCDVAELDREIDVERARRALQRAVERLRNFQDPAIDRERAQRAKERAMARLKAAGAL
ncbi:ATP synthase epsilon chain [bacterium HR17]|jgi:F-type H+-transporting ATPase subunit epsilon|uniref:ATP synthase epsilon chain n=1 Tax=Candidatus Fervidibacter japonicus TaxID=2035412 RepID=A0A2H5XDT6_9BACT|nr:ATP synthase epsilon chain [bacterium HR17]